MKRKRNQQETQDLITNIFMGVFITGIVAIAAWIVFGIYLLFI